MSVDSIGERHSTEPIVSPPRISSLCSVLCHPVVQLSYRNVSDLKLPDIPRKLTVVVPSLSLAL